MPDTGSINQNEIEKIDKIYQWIEFEIQKGLNLISIYKKDNVNLILLGLGLIGFFAFIPLDIFAFKWFESAILMILIASLLPLFEALKNLIIPSLKKRLHRNISTVTPNNDRTSFDELIGFENKKISNLREKITKIANYTLIARYNLINSVNIHCSFVFWGTAMLTYLYCTVRYSSEQNAQLYTFNPHIFLLMILILAFFIIDRFLIKKLLEESHFKTFYKYSLITPAGIMILVILILYYGYTSDIPPFSGIENTSKISIVLYEHSQSISSFSISLIIALYTIILYIVLYEHYFSTYYHEKINQQLLDLNNIKSEIDLYRMGISSEIDMNKLFKRLAKLNIITPKIMTMYGTFSIPIPVRTDFFEEIITIALDDD